MTMTLKMNKPDSRHPLVSARWMLRLSMLSVVLLLVWAAVSPIDQVTRAQGQVIAVSRTQSVQAPDGGPVKQILVKEGEAVKQGQLLMVLEQDRIQTSLNDSRAKVAALRISLARLRAEVYGQTITKDNLNTFVTASAYNTSSTKLVVDLDGAGAGGTSYTLYLQNVAYNPGNTHTIFGV